MPSVRLYLFQRSQSSWNSWLDLALLLLWSGCVLSAARKKDVRTSSRLAPAVRPSNLCKRAAAVDVDDEKRRRVAKQAVARVGCVRTKAHMWASEANTRTAARCDCEYPARIGS